MAKLIPLSDKQMKNLGIVKSKNGFLMREQQIKKIVDDKKAKKEKAVPEKKQEKKQEKPKENIQKVVVVDRSAKAKVNKEEIARLESRGIY